MASRLLLFARPKAHQAWLPTLVVATGVLVTLLLYQALEHREHQLAQMRFESIAEDHVQMIETRIRDVFAAVHLMAGFHHGSGEVSWREFQIYARSIQERQPGLRLLAWAPRVPHEQRATFEAEAPEIGERPLRIREQDEDGTLVAAAEREVYYPVYFVKPFEPHEPLWGLDLASEASANEAITRATQTAELHATAPIILLSELGALRSIWAFQPVYEAGIPEDAPIVGVVAGVFDPRRMIEGILPVFARADVLLEIRDVDAPEPYDLVYRSDHGADADDSGADGASAAGAAQPAQEREERWHIVAADAADDVIPAWEDDLLEDRETTHTDTITVAGRTWRVGAVPSNDFLQAQHTWTPLAVLAAGLGVTVLLGLYLNNLLTRARQIEQEVDQRTAELRDMASALRRSNQSLEEFAYIASHDLQEPLRKVRGFSEMVVSDAGDQLSPDQRDHLQRIQGAAERMQKLITGLLAYSRVTTQSQTPQQVDLTQIVHQVVADLELRIKETGGHVVIDDLPEIEADPLQMRQLFQNLISNALKFHRPDEPPRVHVRGDLLRSGRCRIEVEDNGIGLPAEETERIFKPFQRLHGRDAYDGSGMGLPVCKKIVERHGGTITARGQPGQGATFTVILPCHQAYGDVSHGWPA